MRDQSTELDNYSKHIKTRTTPAVCVITDKTKVIVFYDNYLQHTTDKL